MGGMAGTQQRAVAPAAVRIVGIAGRARVDLGDVHHGLQVTANAVGLDRHVGAAGVGRRERDGVGSGRLDLVEAEHAVDSLEGVRKGCAVAASFLPEDADGEELVLLVEAARQTPASSYPGLAEELVRSVRAATGSTRSRATRS